MQVRNVERGTHSALPLSVTQFCGLQRPRLRFCRFGFEATNLSIGLWQQIYRQDYCIDIIVLR